MAAFALSVVGTAFGGPIGGLIGNIVGGLIDNILFPAHTSAPPKITTSTYGNAIPLPYGPETRLGCNMIWTSGWRKQSGKSAKLASLKGLPPAYESDVAMAVGAGPSDAAHGWCIKIWANGNVLFDSTLSNSPPAPDANGVVTWNKDHKTHKDFDTLVIYPGNALQLPDPTIEAHLGAGDVAAYRGIMYCVINGLVGTAYGNAVPSLQFKVCAHTEISLAQICNDIMARCGLDPTRASTSSLTHLVRGYVIDSQTDGVSALQPLALVYDFDIAEVSGSLRFQARGASPVCTIESVRLAGHAYGEDRPSFEWPRDPETSLPKLAAITFIDPDRDCQPNTQSAKRATGSAQSMLQTSVNVTLDSDDAMKVADRMLWEAHLGRQKLTAATDDRMVFIESARTFTAEVPFGYETIRITRRSRGANNVIEFEATRDAPSLYSSTAPGSAAGALPNGVALGGPVNPPVFIEPPSGFPGVTGATVFIALSGGEAGEANPAWGGCNVYVSTDDIESDYQLAGAVLGPACMGFLTAGLSNYGGSNPDTAHTLSVDTSESAGEPASMSAQDAQDAQTVYFVGGEYLSAETVVGLGSDLFNLTRLWRGLYGTSGDNHAINDPFVRIDSAVFRYSLPDIYIGRVLYFRFVSAGEDISTAVSYTYTPTGVVAASQGSSGTAKATGALAAGDMVNLLTSGGVLSMEKSDATDTTKPADAFVKAAVLSGAIAPFFVSGQINDDVSGLTPGGSYYLAVGGGLAPAPPVVSGQGIQFVGKALSATELLFQPGAITAVP